MCGVNGNGVGIRYAHHGRNVALSNILVKEKFDRLTLPEGKMDPAFVQVLNVMKTILNAVRSDERINPIRLKESLPRLEVPEELSKDLVVNPGPPHPF